MLKEVCEAPCWNFSLLDNAPQLCRVTEVDSNEIKILLEINQCISQHTQNI